MLTQLTARSRTSLERLSKSPGLRYQTILTVLVGAAFALQYGGTIVLLDEMATKVNTAIFAVTVLEIVIAFVVWIGGTVGMYVVSSFVRARFIFGQLFRIVGWGLAPLVGAGLVQSAGRLYVLRDAEPPETPLRSGITYEYEEFVPYLEQAVSEPVFIAATILAIPFVLLSGHLWRLGVEEISDIEPRSAIYMAAVPTVLSLYWILSPLL